MSIFGYSQRPCRFRLDGCTYSHEWVADTWTFDLEIVGRRATAPDFSAKRKEEGRHTVSCWRTQNKEIKVIDREGNPVHRSLTGREFEMLVIMVEGCFELVEMIDADWLSELVAISETHAILPVPENRDFLRVTHRLSQE